MKKSFSNHGPVAEVRPQYLRILDSGEIVKLKNFSEITQLYEVESASGKVFTLQSNKISQQITPEQEMEFIRRQNEHLE
jgi:hypothetical protein